MSRRVAREALFKLVFEFAFNGEQNPDTLQLYLEEADAKDKDYILELYNGISEKYSFLTDKIEKYSHGFALDRVYKVDLSVLLIAVYEIYFYKTVPHQVAINEALEIAKVYSTDKSVRFVNGVLSGIIIDEYYPIED